MQTMTDIEAIFKAHGGIMRTKELQNSGIYYKKLQQMIAAGQIEQIRRGYYQYIDENAFAEAPLIAKLFPDVWCAGKVRWSIMGIQTGHLLHGM